MRILQIINNLGGGGAEKMLSEFVPVMRGMGYQVDVLLLQEKGSVYIESLKQQDIAVYCLSSRGLYSLKNIFRLRTFILEKEYEIVHVHLFPALYIVSLATWWGMKHVKFFFTEHSTNNRRMSNFLFRNIDRLIYKKYDRVICITEAVKKILQKHLAVDDYKLITIANGISLKKLEKKNLISRAQISMLLHKDDILLTMVARLEIQKDHETLLKAMTYLPLNYKLILIGDGILREKLKKMVNELNLKSRVFFLGFRQDVVEILYLMDIAILSSHNEGFGLAAVEAMGCGLPVIASDVQGLSDVVRGAGLLFKKGDYHELVQKIRFLAENRKEYQECADRCKERAGEYSIEKMVDSYLKNYLNSIRCNGNEL